MMALRELWLHTSSWMVASVFGCLAPLVLLVLSALFPGVWISMVGDDGRFQGYFIIGLYSPMSGTAGVLTAASLLTYWSIGITLSTQELLEFRGWKKVFTDTALNIGRSLLFAVLHLLAAIWCLAIKGDYVPSGPWGIYEGNHGPWRHLYDIRRLLHLSFIALDLSILVGGVTFIFTKKFSAVIIVAAAVCTYVALLYSHYWLID